ncbi:hypothetical protein [Parendozoicomonas sp. Alg238-R29]|uniref:hypothetical protein n=1 Tax=Parendozoicomonas sp. Alg238-R29 TaxID=2993446 RepID=UPI00248DEC87|nr:hypothetical protein [Parendozoicomonas sp. Alg238-R29]
MNRETQLAIGIVAGVIILAAGGFWFMSDKSEELAETPLPAFEEPPVPAYQEYSDDDKKIFDSDEMAGDMTRIIVKDSALADDIDVGQVLTGKVIIDDQVVQQPADQ